MNTKLTLKLNEEIIDKAKAYAAGKKISLSKIIENYLSSLTSKGDTESGIKISPFVKSLRSGVKIPADIDYKDAYSDFLLEKYK